jgi:hypothetical protein
MSKPALSLTVYAIYLGVGGAISALFPNFVLNLLGLPPTNEVWIRLWGALAVALAAKGYNGARLNSRESMQFDVYTRTGFATFLVALIVLGLSPPVTIIFAIVDYAASVWTQLALWAERKGRHATA